MNNTIKIPDKIKVGFQNRKDTYTGKLAYVVYYDNSGKLRKEPSWNSWRDDKIEPLELENIPTSGFVLNKKAGGYSTGWNHRQTYARIYDPRGFEFEINIPNLLYILEHTNSIKGKGLEGNFIYSWDGKDILLLPTDSPDYQTLKDYNDTIKNKQGFKGKDMINGATYNTIYNNQVVYMGKYKKLERNYNCGKKVNDEGEVFDSYRSRHREQNESDFHLDTRYILDKKNHYFFYKLDNKQKYYSNFMTVKTLSKFILSEVSTECVDNYANLFEEMERFEEYNPYDVNKDKYVNHTLDSFTKYIGSLESRYTIYYAKNNDDKNDTYYRSGYDMYFDKEKNMFYEKQEVPLTEEDRKSLNYYSWKKTKEITVYMSIKEVFEREHPQYKKEYLKDGKLREVKYYEQK